jgi:hypothetical protein
MPAIVRPIVQGSAARLNSEALRDQTASDPRY